MRRQDRSLPQVGDGAVGSALHDGEAVFEVRDHNLRECEGL